LIELLVVIAVIALLVAILLPALNTAKSISRSSLCQSNLHNLAQAYASRQANLMLNGKQANAEVIRNPWGWPGDLSPYVGDVSEPFQCPEADPFKEGPSARAPGQAPTQPRPCRRINAAALTDVADATVSVNRRQMITWPTSFTPLWKGLVFAGMDTRPESLQLVAIGVVVEAKKLPESSWKGSPWATRLSAADGQGAV